MWFWKNWALSLCLAVFAGPVLADSVVATRTIRAQALVMPDDITLADTSIPGVYQTVEEVLGMEARVAIYAGRPIRQGDVGPPALVERNQIVPLAFRSGSLTIMTDGRAMQRGGLGDTIRIMNLASRTTVSGTITADGTVYVLGGH